MIAVHSLPFCLGEWPEWLELATKLNSYCPNFSRKAVTNRIEQEAEVSRAKLRSKFKEYKER